MEIKPYAVLACLIVFFLLCNGLVTCTGYNVVGVDTSGVVFFGDVLYVGGDGPGNYTHIQDAVDDASDGDTVFVFNGTYYEHLLIDRAITLLGENAAYTIVDGFGGGCVVSISAAVRMCGFTIQHGEKGIENYGLLYDSVFIVEGNVIRNNVVGIAIGGSQGHVIRGNSIIFNEIGVNLFSTRGCDFHENNFQSNGVDAYFEFLHFPPVLLRNSWKHNYWDEWSLPLPKPVRGKLVIVFVIRPGSAYKKPLCPWFNFDWRPACEPFDIGVLTGS